MTRIIRCKHCRTEVDEATRILSIQEFGATFCSLKCWREWSRMEAIAEGDCEWGDPHA